MTGSTRTIRTRPPARATSPLFGHRSLSVEFMNLPLSKTLRSLERAFAHLLTTGGMRRTHLRGHENIRKRMLVHAAGFNLGLLMRSRFGLARRRSP